MFCGNIFSTARLYIWFNRTQRVLQTALRNIVCFNRREKKICVFHSTESSPFISSVSNKSNGQFVLSAFSIWEPLVMQFAGSCIRAIATFGCIFDEFSPIKSLFHVEKERSGSEIKKTIQLRDFFHRCVFWLHSTPIKITLNSIRMSWSTVLSWVPTNNRKMLHSFFLSLFIHDCSYTIPISINAELG